jgi:hypothetical protein
MLDLAFDEVVSSMSVYSTGDEMLDETGTS